jgi:hypothetical protein
VGDHEEVQRLLEGKSGGLPRKLWKRAQFAMNKNLRLAGAYDDNEKPFDGATLR